MTIPLLVPVLLAMLCMAFAIAILCYKLRDDESSPSEPRVSAESERRVDVGNKQAPGGSNEAGDAEWRRGDSVAPPTGNPTSRGSDRVLAAHRLSHEQLVGFYGLNQHVLRKAINFYRSGIPQATAAIAVVAEIGRALDETGHRSPGEIATYTGELFARIAGLDGFAAAAWLQALNNRLHDVRALETQRLDNVQAELLAMCELFIAERYDKLEIAIALYHDRRRSLLRTDGNPLLWRDQSRDGTQGPGRNEA